MFHIFLIGFLSGLSLILAIGAQNAFVLKQGIKKHFIGSICLLCALSDALLIFFGVYGAHSVYQLAPWLQNSIQVLGIAFLLMYGSKSLYSAFKTNSMMVLQDDKNLSYLKTMGVTLALTWLNPHVYLDTIIMLGSISSQFAQHPLYFALGATTASFIFFFSLGYGSRFLLPLFSSAPAWRVLEIVTAGIMFYIAGYMIFELFNN